MFEKIKEYMFVIVISLWFAAALVFAILKFNTTKEGWKIFSIAQNSVITAVWKSDTYKKNHTIASEMLDNLTGKSIGKYNIQTSSWVLFLNNTGWNDITANWKYGNDFPTSESQKLYPILMPATAIWQIGWKDLGWLKSSEFDDVNWTKVDDASNLTSSQKGYLVDLYFGFGTFATKADADSFQKSYLSSSDEVEGSGGNYTLFQKIAQQ